MIALPLLALIAGAAIAIQATLNARLGVLLNSSMLGTGVAFFCAFAFIVAALVFSARSYPQMAEIKSVPVYLWFAGGALSAFGVGMFYYLIPKMGVGAMMSYALSGQLLIAMLASHFSWFDLPHQPIIWLKVIGIVALMLGMFFINWEPGYAR